MSQNNSSQPKGSTRKVVNTKTEEQKKILFDFFENNKWKWKAPEMEHLMTLTGLGYKEIYKWNHYQLSKVQEEQANSNKQYLQELSKERLLNQQQNLNQNENESISQLSISNKNFLQNIPYDSSNINFQQIPQQQQQQPQQQLKFTELNTGFQSQNNMPLQINQTMSNKYNNILPQMPCPQEQLYKVLKYCLELDQWHQNNQELIKKTSEQNLGLTDLQSPILNLQERRNILKYYNNISMWQQENFNYIISNLPIQMPIQNDQSNKNIPLLNLNNNQIDKQNEKSLNNQNNHIKQKDFINKPTINHSNNSTKIEDLIQYEHNIDSNNIQSNSNKSNINNNNNSNNSNNNNNNNNFNVNNNLNFNTSSLLQQDLQQFQENQQLLDSNSQSKLQQSSKNIKKDNDI